MYLPNFEMFIGQTKTPLFRYYVELIAEKMNNEIMTRYKISKDSVLKGLKSSVSSEIFLNLVDEFDFSEDQIKMIKCWANDFLCATFQEVVVLRLIGPKIWNELKMIDKFNKYVQEEIPNFGVIVQKKDKEALSYLLMQMGIYPREVGCAQQSNVEPFQFYSEYPYRTVSYSQDKVTVLPSLLSLEDKVSNSKSSSKIPAFEQKLTMIENAVTKVKNLEVSFVEQKTRKLVTPLRVINKTSIIVTNLKTGSREELKVGDITSVRVVS